jgi:hypothetical protein
MMSSAAIVLPARAVRAVIRGRAGIGVVGFAV